MNNLQEKINTVLCGDVLEKMRDLPDASIDCVITSPPYYQLRDYKWTGQWGLEPTFQLYLEHLWSFMDEVWRVLKDTGTVFINLGDTYSAKGSSTQATHTQFGKNDINIAMESFRAKDLPSKCLLAIPHRFMIGCIDGVNGHQQWICRNDLLWPKRNGLPEPVRDRWTKKHEFIFFFTKKSKYYFDLDSIKMKSAYTERWGKVGDRGEQKQGFQDNQKYNETKNPGDVADFWDNYRKLPFKEFIDMMTEWYYSEDDFWDIPTKPNSEKHYATFNSELIDKPIIAGSPEGGIILDPFAGTGTTLLRALELRRNVIGIEGKKEYCDITEKKLKDFQDQLKLI